MTMAFISCVLRGYPSQPRHFPKSSESTEELTDSVSADPSQQKSMDSAAKTQLCSNFEKTLRREPAPFCSKDKKTSFSKRTKQKTPGVSRYIYIYKYMYNILYIYNYIYIYVCVWHVVLPRHFWNIFVSSVSGRKEDEKTKVSRLHPSCLYTTMYTTIYTTMYSTKESPI